MSNLKDGGGGDDDVEDALNQPTMFKTLLYIQYSDDVVKPYNNHAGMNMTTIIVKARTGIITTKRHDSRNNHSLLDQS